MKRFLALAALVLGLAACQTEPEGLDVNMGGDVATISVVLPADAITRAAADETDSAWSGLQNVKDETLRVIFQVYDENGETNENLRQVKTLNEGELTANFNVRLVPDRQYTFVAWADQGEEYFDAANLEDVKILDWKAMDECRDAFTDTHTEKKFNSASNITLKLTRPFAKLRVITTDMEQLGHLNIAPAEAEVAYTVELPNAFNAFAGEACATTAPKSFTTFDIAEYNQDAANTKTLFTDYILVPANNVVKFSLKTMQDGGREIKTNNFNTDIPVERNNLTTIMGNVLTEGNNITVTVEEDFAQPELEMDELSRVAMFEGGKYTLTEDVVLTSPLVVKQNMVLNLNGKTITTTEEQAGRHHYAIDNYGTLTIEGEGAINARGIENFGTMTINGNITITNVDTNGGAAIWNEGNLVINGGTFTTNAVAGEGSYGAALNTRENGTVVVNGGNFIANSQLTYAIINAGKTVINDATVKGKHGAVAGGDSQSTEINGGSFELMENPNVSDHCVYYVSDIKGGKFTLGANTDCGAQVFYASTIATGYKAIAADGVYYVLSETIANAAEAECVTSVTESTADVATALATDNGEATLFMWNDVAYIAKYGEVVITSAADEATTVRSVVEGSTGLTSATVADGIEVVGNRTFRKCANLETVALPNTLTEIGPGVFQSCSKLANITIPESVTTIGEGSFQECSSLESINIPTGVTRIESDALRATGLKSVEFHAGVTYFGAQAFRDCKQLKEVYINAPEFTIEPNAFGVMSGTLPGTTIYVANAKMKEYLEKTLSYKNQFTIVAPSVVDDAEDLTDALANGEYVVLTQDVTSEAATTAPYGNKYAFKQDGGVIDGNGHELHMECYGDDYGIMTSGGTIKNITIKEGCRAVMIMCPQQDVVLDNVKIGGDGVLYPINTGEAGAEGVNLIVTNSVLAGWTSYGLIESASFTNVEFKQGTYYNNIYGRVLKPYVNTTLTNCSFVEHMNLDLSKLTNGHKIVMKNCTVDGQAVTAEVFTIPSTDAQYDTELFTVDLPSWASSINACVVFE